MSSRTSSYSALFKVSPEIFPLAMDCWMLFGLSPNDLMNGALNITEPLFEAKVVSDELDLAVSGEVIFSIEPTDFFRGLPSAIRSGEISLGPIPIGIFGAEQET